MRARPERRPFQQRTRAIGLRVDVSNVAEALDLLDDLVTDAHLAALAIEHGVGVCSADSDFARFPKLDWFNPLTAG
ncbi:hypothetical protein [Streptosporangium sp. NBC_01756]|uniref:hypothetical protein n=1 Tax=Streptosporangium sp. NBC_01756 TaxID=2975950 RepID=UPI002DD846DA|nr:hypothetical protein [Streptosporangium sp. NBC_01756]WSC88910.1 hypothetical protein OIE48_12205 [Streptosporangium sp. NBC_01756]